jgi:hypothetical protein
MKINTILDELEKYLPHANKSNPKISQRGVDWHIDHSLKVINTISQAIINSNPKEYKKQFKWIKWYFFTFKIIPRGKVKAPKIVVEENPIQTSELEAQFVLARKNLEQLTKIDPNSFFVHPMLGKLNALETLKFFPIHTQHHIKIIKDIIS